MLTLAPALAGNGNVLASTSEQAIEQAQISSQAALCASGTNTLLSCNNISLQDQNNTGNNALAQSGGNGLLSGNSAAQGIGQSQESDQSSLVASGGNTDLSGNNINLQDQTNTGNNALAQSGGQW